MKFIKIVYFIIINFFFVFSYACADQQLKFANIDEILQKTEIGKKTLNKINEIDKSNIKKLNNFEKELKEQEKEIELKRNVISEEQFNKEVNQLKKKIVDFNKKKNLMVKEFSNMKKRELKNLFDMINPIIQNYMSENSIEILLNTKNVFIGSKKSDLTDILIKEINIKINQ